MDETPGDTLEAGRPGRYNGVRVGTAVILLSFVFFRHYETNHFDTVEFV